MIGKSLFELRRLPRLRLRLISSTQALLGDTIGLGDSEWQSPSALPGWTRAHVASHLTFNAEGLAAAAARLLGGERLVPWPEDQTDAELERQSRRRAVDLQVALDTSTGLLLETLDLLDDDHWTAQFQTDQGRWPALALPYARLNEVVLHHLDLRLSLTWADLDNRLVESLLHWNAARLDARLRHVRLRLLSDEGFDVAIGGDMAEKEIRGANVTLLGWLTGRLDQTAVLGAEDVDLGGPL